MSKISIEGNALGSGTITIAAPNTNSNATLTLPTASGTVVTTAGAQTIEFAAGTAGAPSITFTGDTNTGIFSPAADTIAFSEGGAEAMRISSNGDLGLGKSPEAQAGFTIFDIGAGSTSGLIDLRQNGSRQLRVFNSSTDSFLSNSTNGGSIAFQTTTSGGSSGERMRIDSSGNVGIGTSSPSQKLEVAGNIFINTSGNPTMTVKTSGAGNNPGYVLTADTNSWAISGIFSDATDPLQFAYNGTERARITSDGDLLVGTTSSNGRITGQSSSSSSNSFALGTKNSSSTDLFRVRGDGALYLGLAASSPYNLTTGTAANAFLETNGYLYRSTSSRKYKTQIEDIDASRSQAILNFRPVWYRSLCKDDNKSWSYYGLIAEEVAEIEPRLVFWGYNENDYEEVTTETPVERERTVTDENGNETIETYTEVETKTERKLKEDAQLAPEGVQYERLTVLLLDVVKRQDASIKALSTQLALCEARIAALETGE